MRDKYRIDRLDRREYLTGLGSVVATVGFAGCTGDGSQGSQSTTAKQSIDYWMFGGGTNEKEWIKDTTANFSAHEINYAHKSWGKKYEILASASANQNLPDVFSSTTQQIPDYADLGAVQPVDQEPYADEVASVNERFIDEIVDINKFEGIGDTDGVRQWSFPFGFADVAPFIDIREDYLEETSFDGPPRNWEEFEQMAKEMQEIDDVTAAVTTPGTDFGLTSGYFMAWVYTNGGRYFNRETLEATIDAPGFKNTAKLYERLANVNALPDSIAENNHLDAARLFMEGKSGIFITRSAANLLYAVLGGPQDWIDGKGHIVTRAPLPEDPSGDFQPKNLSMLNGAATMMTGGTENDAERRAAFDFMKWWQKPENLAPWQYEEDIGVRGRLPTLESTWENPTDLFKQQFGDLIELYDNDKLFNQTIRFPSFTGIASVQSEINTKVLQPVMLGNKTAEEACEDAQPEVQSIIDDKLA